jgi:hypothetical protein
LDWLLVSILFLKNDIYLGGNLIFLFSFFFFFGISIEKKYKVKYLALHHYYMSTWNISKKLKNDIIERAKNTENNDSRLLYLLRNMGPLRFTTLIKYSGLSRSTVSKYLKLHLKYNNIEKNFFNDKTRNIQEQRYFITEKGVEKLNEEPSDQENLLYINELNENISNLSDLVQFYKKIGVEESIYFQIVKIISKIGENFFLIEQNPDFYLTMFYVFFNSVLTRNYKFEINAFCEHYKVKKLRVEFYVDKVMSSKLGFFMFTRDDDVFFFHEEDILGTTTLHLIRDRIIEEIVYINLNGYRKIYDLDKIADVIAQELINMDLIWDRIREPFEMIIEKLLIKNAIDMGMSKTFLMDIVIQSEKLSKSKEGVNSLFNIINGSERYEDLNIVSLPVADDSALDNALGQMRGFCPSCGKIILKHDFSKECSRCKEKFEPQNLLKSIDEAKKANIQYKEFVKEELFKCPNPKCDYFVKSSWDLCPECLTPIKNKKN